MNTKQAVEESLPMSVLGLSGLSRALSPSQQDQLHDRGFLNRFFRGTGRDALTDVGAAGGALPGGLLGGLAGSRIGRAFEKNPEMALVGGALGGALGGVSGAFGGSVGGYEAGGGDAPPISFMDKLKLLMHSKQASAIYRNAFNQRMATLIKEAAPIAEAAGEMAGKALPGLLSRQAEKGLFDSGIGAVNHFGEAFGSGARDAEKGIFGAIPGDYVGRAEQWGHALGNTRPGAWVHSHPGTAGAIGTGVGAMGLQKGYDNAQNNARRRAVGNAGFGDRLGMALQYMVNPQAVAGRLY